MAAASLALSTAQAAQDGERGSTSTGSLQISLQIQQEVRLSGLRDLQLSSDQHSARAQSPACIYVSDTGQYQLSASGSGAGQAFMLRSADASLPYAVHYDDGRGSQTLVSGNTLRGLRGGDTGSPICENTGENGTVQVQVPPEALQNATPGTYAGTLTLLIAPD